MKRWILSVILLIAAILVLASCTDPDPYYVPEKGSEETAERTTETSAEQEGTQEGTKENTSGIITPIIPFPEAESN